MLPNGSSRISPTIPLLVSQISIVKNTRTCESNTSNAFVNDVVVNKSLELSEGGPMRTEGERVVLFMKDNVSPCDDFCLFGSKRNGSLVVGNLWLFVPSCSIGCGG